tara:strand:+ start:993 stop:1730 length:738 start_codon:yes stop_codon:yes gene_type:complete
MNIWKKTNYKNLKKKNISHHAFNNLVWEKKILDKINLNKTFLKKNYSKFFLSSSPLPLILLEYKKKKIKIADYGSGDQEIFFQLLNSKIKGVKFFIDSIEVPKITNVLKKTIKKKYSKNIQINFYDKYNFNKKYDFVHISDSLQYNVNWRDFLTKISLKKPQYIILNNLTAGKFKTYITEQKFYKDKLPYIFFNENEIKKIFKRYRTYQYLYLNKINNEYKEYPQKNFKKKDRLRYPKTIIFKKN